MHLIVDGHAENTELMTNEPALRGWLQLAVKKAGMEPFGRPYIQGFPWPGSTDWSALTAFQPMMESGLSVHCWPERKFAFVDLFSCGEFDAEAGAAYIAESFGMVAPTVLLLRRGVAPDGSIMAARVTQV